MISNTFFFYKHRKHVFQQYFLNHSFHIFLNNNFWNTYIINCVPLKYSFIFFSLFLYKFPPKKKKNHYIYSILLWYIHYIFKVHNIAIKFSFLFLFPSFHFHVVKHTIRVEDESKTKGPKGLFGFQKMLTHHSNIITHHSITHHLSLKIPQLPKVACLALVSNFDNLKNFTFCGTHGLTWCSFYFLFLFLFIFSFNPQYPNSPNPNCSQAPFIASLFIHSPNLVPN